FPGRDSGKIEVRVTRESPTHLLLTVRDDGTGYEPGHQEPSGLGRSLIDAFVRQLRGELEIESRNGTQVTVRFPSSVPEPSPAAAKAAASAAPAPETVPP
ncbi:MAG TPA: ATP-binding protein, partial [Steroidobacteraceae bacterium]